LSALDCLDCAFSQLVAADIGRALGRLALPNVSRARVMPLPNSEFPIVPFAPRLRRAVLPSLRFIFVISEGMVCDGAMK